MTSEYTSRTPRELLIEKLLEKSSEYEIKGREDRGFRQYSRDLFEAASRIETATSEQEVNDILAGYGFYRDLCEYIGNYYPV